MRNLKKGIFIKNILILIPLIIVTGCLKDNVNPLSNFEASDSIAILLYLESNGDIINSQSTANAFVSASNLYADISNYIILDIRDPQLFADGHISGSINIISSDLLTKIKSIGSTNVILVSQNGQSASYYGGLLRLDGLSNVYILKFGMAGWNDHFANNWKNASGHSPSGLKYFNNLMYKRGPYTALPEIKFSSSGDIKTKIENRIEYLLSEKFDDGVVYSNSSSLTVYSQDAFNTNIYTSSDSTFDGQYIACYGDPSLYSESLQNPNLPYHSPHCAFYQSFHAFKAMYYLQTIPSNKKVVLYSSSGHLSAFSKAYLELLGYTNVRSLLFGAVWFNPFPGSMNYPYIN